MHGLGKIPLLWASACLAGLVALALLYPVNSGGDLRVQSHGADETESLRQTLAVNASETDFSETRMEDAHRRALGQLRPGLHRAKAEFRLVGGTSKAWVYSPVELKGEDGRRICEIKRGNKESTTHFELPTGLSRVAFGLPGYRSVERQVPEPSRGEVDFGEVVLVPDAAVLVRVGPLPEVEDKWIRIFVIFMPESGSQGHQHTFSKTIHATPGGLAEARLVVPSGQSLYVQVTEYGKDPKPRRWGLLSQTCSPFALRSGEERILVYDLTRMCAISGELCGVPRAALAGKKICARSRSAFDDEFMEFGWTLTDEKGHFRLSGLQAGTVSLQLVSNSPFTLIEEGTGASQWDLQGDTRLRVRPTPQAVAIVITRAGKELRRPYSVSLTSITPREAAAKSTAPLFRRSQFEKADQLKVWVEGSGHFKKRVSGLKVDPRGLVFVPLPGPSGSILLQNSKAATLPWRVAARPAAEDWHVFPQAGVLSHATDQGWLLDGLEPGEYRLHFYHPGKRWSRLRADWPGTVQVRAGELSTVRGTPPSFRRVEVRITNWRAIPKHLRPTRLAVGKWFFPEQPEHGSLGVDLPEPLWQHRQIRFIGDGNFQPDLPTHKVVLDVARRRLSVEFPIDRLGIRIQIAPRFGGKTHLTVQRSRNPGRISTGAYGQRVLPGPDGSITLASGMEQDVCLWEEGPEPSRVLRGWLHVTGQPQKLSLNPGGRWVTLLMRQGHARCKVRLAGPFSSTSPQTLRGTNPRRLWIPEGTESILFASDVYGRCELSPEQIGTEAQIDLRKR